MKRTLIIVAVVLAILVLGYFLWRMLSPSRAAMVTHFPVLEQGQTMWSLVDLDGTVVTSRFWNEPPSVAVNGIVRVRNKDGRYNLYTAEPEPQRIGGDYVAVGLFTGEVAPAVKPDGPVVFIDRSGREVVTLKEIDSQLVKWVSNLTDGYAVYEAANGKCGMIDARGEVVIKARYDRLQPFHDGLALAAVGKGRDVKAGFVNEKGEEVIPLKKDVTYLPFSEGLAAFSDPASEQWGFIDTKGDTVIRPRKEFTGILFGFHDGHATFSDGSSYGLIDKEGAIVLPAKYQGCLYHDGRVLVQDSGKSGFLSLDGRPLIPPTASFAYLPFLGKNTFARGDSGIIVVDPDGKRVGSACFERLEGVVDALQRNMFHQAFERVESDLFDADAVAAFIARDVFPGKAAGWDNSSTAAQIIRQYDYPADAIQPEWTSITTAIDGTPSGIRGTMEFEFSGVISKGAVDPATLTLEDIANYNTRPQARLTSVKYTLVTSGRALGKEERVAAAILRILVKNGFQRASVENRTTALRVEGRGQVGSVSWNTDRVSGGAIILRIQLPPAETPPPPPQ